MHCARFMGFIAVINFGKKNLLRDVNIIFNICNNHTLLIFIIAPIYRLLHFISVLAYYIAINMVFFFHT